MRLKFDTHERTSTCGKWVVVDRNCHVCGNVMVRNLGGTGPGEEKWWIFVKKELDDEGHWTWERVIMKQRKWGYAHQGAAKIAARLCGNQFGRKSK